MPPGWCDEALGCDTFGFFSVSAKYVLLVLDTCFICCCLRVVSGDSDSGEPRCWKREML